MRGQLSSREALAQSDGSSRLAGKKRAGGAVRENLRPSRNYMMLPECHIFRRYANKQKLNDGPERQCTTSASRLAVHFNPSSPQRTIMTKIAYLQEDEQGVAYQVQ